MAFLKNLLRKQAAIQALSEFLDTNRPGPTIAIRADLDAVPVQETSAEEHEAVKGNYVSEIPGVMHACGHDAHTSILLAAAEWVVRNKEHLLGKYKSFSSLLEEGCSRRISGGERRNSRRMDEIICFHVGSNAS